jgi:hypothetical protein
VCVWVRARAGGALNIIAYNNGIHVRDQRTLEGD